MTHQHAAHTPSGHDGDHGHSHDHATAHGHLHVDDIDFGEHIQHLEYGVQLWSEVSELVMAELPVPPDAVVADIGSGAGEQTVALARRAARVYAVDRESVLLDLVRSRAERAGVSDVVRTVETDLADLPGALPEPVHLAWAGHVVHHAGDQVAALGRVVAALLPGGVLAVAEGGRALHGLPWDAGVGDPGLETRLSVAHDRWFASMRASLPGAVREPRGWSAMLRAAGLEAVTSRGWLLHLPAPLGHGELAAVLHWLVGRVERATPWLDAADLAAWRRLLDADDPAWLGHRDDLEVTAVETVHLGRRPE